MFPKRRTNSRRNVRLPRTHGGVSYDTSNIELKIVSSPHTRGCFLIQEDARVPPFVFPAHTGVFLSSIREEKEKLLALTTALVALLTALISFIEKFI